MEPIYEFTESQLAAAFANWIKDVKNNPKDFDEENSDDGKKEAKVLLEYLGKK